MIILAEKKDAVLINPPLDEPVELFGLRIGHVGTQSSFAISKIVSVFTGSEKNSKKASLKHLTNQAKHMNSNLISNCLIKVTKGSVTIRKCLLSYKLLTKSQENQSIGLVADQDTKVTVEDSEFTGSESHYSIGILIKNSDVTIKRCIVSGFKQSGIIAYLQG